MAAAMVFSGCWWLALGVRAGLDRRDFVIGAYALWLAWWFGRGALGREV
jgi:hypothetical protein